MIWPIKCLILTSTNHLQNLLRDGTPSVISTVRKISILGSLNNAENAKRQFFWAPCICQLGTKSYTFFVIRTQFIRT